MRLAFSDDHHALQAEFERVFAIEAQPERARLAAASEAGWDQALWRRLADLGWLGVAIEERHGGQEQDTLSLCLLAEAFGRRLAAIPFGPAILGFAESVRRAGDDGLAAELLPGIVAGEVVGLMADSESWSEARIADGRFSGRSKALPDASGATHLITKIGAGLSASIVVVELGGARRDRVDSLDRINIALALTLEDAPARVVLTGLAAERLWRDLRARYVTLLAFVQIGGAEAALDAAREHVLQRYAFGRPLGSFQAIKHGLADVLCAIEIGRSNAWFAAASLDRTGDGLIEAAAAARVSATQAHRKAARANLHYLGALGVTEEGNAQLLYRRAQALGMTPGTPNAWREILFTIALGARTPASAGQGESAITA